MKSKLFSNDDMFSYFSEKSTIYDSPMRENDLNDSLEIFSNTEDRQIEKKIVKYLHSLGLQTKTDPQIKELQYWKVKKEESQRKMDSLLGQTHQTLNTYALKLMSNRESYSNSFQSTTTDLTFFAIN